MSGLLVATKNGLFLPEENSQFLEGHSVDALSRGAGRWLFTIDGVDVAWRSDDGTISDAVSIGVSRVNCAVERGTGILVGAAEAQLFEHSNGATDRREDFDRAPGRDAWYTPWGGPPDVRSMAVNADGGTVYLNVHVGGVLRWQQDEPTWQDTMDIDADVHQVIAHPVQADVVLAASARGLGVSDDRGHSWDWRSEGLHGDYCRAVAVSGESVFVSASLGSRGHRAAIYRGSLGGGPFIRCEAGLPEWFSTNVNTHCLAADGGRVVAGDADGTLYASEDAGVTWQVLARVDPINAVGLSSS